MQVSKIIVSYVALALTYPDMFNLPYAPPPLPTFAPKTELVTFVKPRDDVSLH